MANNRLYLVHEPSGLGICLATRLGSEWRVVQPDTLVHRLMRLLDEAFLDGDVDDIRVALEDAGGALDILEVRGGKPTRIAGVLALEFEVNDDLGDPRYDDE